MKNIKTLFTINALALISLTSFSQRWTQIGNNFYGDLAHDRLGHSVSLSEDGNILAVGAPSDPNETNNPGKVTIYQWNDSAWVQKGDVINGQNADVTGTDVSLNSDGSIIAISAPNAGTSGRVRVKQ